MRLSVRKKAAVEAWAAGVEYKVGDVREWRGVRILCTKAHRSDPKMAHPWDGRAIDAEDRAVLWTPDGADEVDVLQKVRRKLVAGKVDEDRDLCKVLVYATGVL